MCTENLYDHKSHFLDDIWDYCSSKITNDQPKVTDVITPTLFDIDEIVDHTSGRNFGPDRSSDHGLIGQFIKKYNKLVLKI